jgi:hypothetical protein
MSKQKEGRVLIGGAANIDDEPKLMSEAKVDCFLGDLAA